MEKRSDMDFEEMRMETDDELGLRQDEDPGDQDNRESSGFHSDAKSIIYGGVGLLALILILILLFRNGSEVSREDLEGIQVRLERIEKHAQSLDDQAKALKQGMEKLNKNVGPLKGRLDKVNRDIGQLKKSIAALEARKPASTPVQEPVASGGKTRAYEIRRGDTLFSIAKRFGMTVEELCRLNNFSKNEPIHPGQTLLVRSN